MESSTRTPRGTRKVLKEVVRKIEAAVDDGVRRDCDGLTVEDVEVLAGQRFAAAGVALPEAKLKRYAEAVVAGEPFEFRLQ